MTGTDPRCEELELHGHLMSYWLAGDGDAEKPVVVLIHGVTGSAEQWHPAMQLLSERYTVMAPDLLGHGRSAKPRGDYSLGAYASGVRDLMLATGHPRATIVGHSLGGGIAMQLAYQFPERCERLALVSSGGLGREVSILLRAATLPGSELVLPLIAHERIRNVGIAMGTALRRFGLRAGPDMAEMARGYGSLSDADARNAFIHTLRAVIEPGGQRVSATDRLYLAEEMPSLIVWGRRDPMIPVHHGEEAHAFMPGSRLEIHDEAGHFPQLDDPIRFCRTLSAWIEDTEPADLGADDMAERLQAPR